MRTTNLRRVGGSIMMTLPPAMLDMLHLDAGSQVNIDIKDGRLVVEPKKQPRYTLEELLSQCDPNAELSADEKEWLDDGLVGKELV